MWRGSFGAAIKFAEDIARGMDAIASGELQDAISKPMAAIGRQQLLDTFRTSKEPNGTRWKPLVARNGKPLVLTGALRSSSDCKIGPGDDASGFDVTYTLTDEKAIWHQKGTRRGGAMRKSGRGRGAIADRFHIPPRKMLFETARDAAKWIAELVLVARDRGEAWMRQNFRRV